MSSAVVFAYHNVGLRCLQVLLAQGVEVCLVVTHEDSPGENIWFGNVKKLAQELGLPVITPSDPNIEEIVAQLRAAQPDFLFSFYYRHMLKASLLNIPKRGSYNMHGSLLPKYRGRVPTHWAIIKGETETGATLHAMTEKPDNGDIVDQTAVPILPNDSAQEVFEKTVVAAELTLHRCLPALLAGTARHTRQDLSKGAYFSGRKAEDGRIQWTQSARDIHNLVRAVTRPYPGAFCDTAHGRLFIWRSLRTGRVSRGSPELLAQNGTLFARCGDGGLLRILDAELDGKPLTASSLPLALG